MLVKYENKIFKCNFVDRHGLKTKTSCGPMYRRPPCFEEKTSTHQPTRHRIYADSSQPTPDTSLSNADCRLASTADSTFESALIGGIRPSVGLNFRTHLPTAVCQLSLHRLVGRCVLNIGRRVLSISLPVYPSRHPRAPY